MCYEHATSGLFCNTTECGPLSTSLAVALRNEAPTIRDKVLLYLPSISDEVIVNRVNWTRVNSITYTANGSYVLWKRTNAHLAEPTLYFGCIKEILIVGSNLPLFLVSLCPTEYYDEHYHAYVISHSSEQAILSQEHLLDPNVFHCRAIEEKAFITMKYLIN